MPSIIYFMLFQKSQFCLWARFGSLLIHIEYLSEFSNFLSNLVLRTDKVITVGDILNMTVLGIALLLFGFFPQIN